MVASPLVAYSTDGSLIGIHHPDSSSSAKNGLIRCYDGNISNGSLKFTLRFPLHSNQTNSNLPDGLPSLSSDKAINNNSLHKLIFASSNNNKPTHLCGMTSNNNTILLFNIERGVLSSTINISSDSNSNKKKKRKSSLSTSAGNEILVDVIASNNNNSLYALVYFPTNDTDSSSSNNVGGKCRLYQYTLTDNEEPTLIKKIKVGSVSGSSGGKMVFGLGISKSNIVVRLNNQVRVVDLGSGDKLCKLELPSGGVNNSNDEESEDGGTSFVPLAVTNDGRYIVTTSSSSGGNQAVVLSYANQDNAKHSLKSLAMLSTKDDEASTSNFDITQLDNNDELAIVAFQSKIGTSSLFNIPTSNDDNDSSTPTLSKSTLQTNELDKQLSLIGSTFNSRKPTKSLTLLFNQGKKHVGAGSAGTGTNLPMESLPLNDTLEGNVLVGTSLSTVDEKGNKKKDDKKRKVNDNVALAPGDQGLEASTAMDLSQAVKKKKARVSSSTGEEGEEAAAGEDEDDFDLGEDDDDEEGENGQSIAERLALLSSAMEQSDDDTDSEDDEAQDSSTKQAKPFKLKSATSETLTTLLTQALTSNDSSQLNIALQVTDRRLVEGTVRALQSLDAERRASQLSATETHVASSSHPGYVSMLMAHIVRRMARRHTLVNVLGVWVKAILAATARSTSYQGGGGGSVEEQIMANEGREMALKLGPLKNFLNERVECFPQLLRLEGRLSLLNQQF